MRINVAGLRGKNKNTKWYSRIGNRKDNDFQQSNIEGFVNHRTTVGDIFDRDSIWGMV